MRVQRKTITAVHCIIRSGTSLIETIVVLAIIGTLLALLLPALSRARSHALETTCKNNLHQMFIATSRFGEYKKKLPDAAPANSVGGWAIDILPFLEERPLAEALAGNPPIARPSILGYIKNRPIIMTCPTGWEGDSRIAFVPSSHYALHRSVDHIQICDVPTSSRFAWVESPELRPGFLPRGEGPHSGGYFVATSNGDVSWQEQ